MDLRGSVLMCPERDLPGRSAPTRGRKYQRIRAVVLLSWVLGVLAATVVLVDHRAEAADGICDRTPAVRDAIVAAVPQVDACEDVTDAHLAAVTGTLSLREAGLTALQPGDFEGLTAITHLKLSHNSLTSLPSGVFDGLAQLQDLGLERNALHSLPGDVFSGLSELKVLDLKQNQLTTVHVDLFEDLTKLESLDIEFNQLAALPAGFLTTST